MHVVSSDCVKVNLFGEEIEILFTYGMDIELTKIFSTYLGALADIAKDKEGDPIALELQEALKAYDAGASEPAAHEEFVASVGEILARTAGSSLSEKLKVAGFATSEMLNAFSQVISVLLTRYDDMGKVVLPVTVSQVMHGAKYSREPDKTELKELYQFAYERFFSEAEGSVGKKSETEVAEGK